MRYRNIAIVIFSIMLMVVAFYCFWVDTENSDMPLTAVVISDDHAEEIKCWKDSWGDFCFFLPGYADPSQVQIRSHTKDEIWLGDHMLMGDSLWCDQFRFNETYGMARFGSRNSYDGVLHFVQSGNVPTLFVDVASGNMEYIHQKKGNAETGNMRLYTADGELAVNGRLESIKGRGNATWEWAKKSYSLTFPEETDLLEMGQAQRWILLSNGYDFSSLKNKVSYDLARSAGMAYSPDSQWVDLYLNGEYAGLYLLCERIEVHPSRVDITADDSFLVSREVAARLIAQSYPYVYMNHDKAYRIHHSSYPLEQVEEMWRSVEGALLSADGVDPQTGKHWSELIDLDSWVEKYLIDEIAANHDGGAISQYFYYDGANSHGKIFAGPVWDMDITYGADFWYISSPNCFSARKPCCLDETDNSPFYRLYQQEEFYHRMVEMYEKNFRPLLIELIDSGLDRYAQEISQAAYANQTRWLTDSSEKGKEIIKTFLSQRVAFLDSIWIREEEYCDVVMLGYDETTESYYIIAWFAVRPGEVLPDVPTENGDWYVCDTHEPFDVTQPIYENVNIYLKQDPVPQNAVVLKEELAVVVVLVTILGVVVVIDKMRGQKYGTDRKRQP